MPQVLCLLEHAADKINGISFTLYKIDGQPAGMISEEITEGQAEHFAKIPGYELVVEAEKPAVAPAAPAPAPAPKPEPVPAAPKAPTKAEKAAAAVKAAEEKEAADKAAADAKEADEKAAADKAAAEQKDDKKDTPAAGDKPAEEVF